MKLAFVVSLFAFVLLFLFLFLFLGRSLNVVASSATSYSDWLRMLLTRRWFFVRQGHCVSGGPMGAFWAQLICDGALRQYISDMSDRESPARLHEGRQQEQEQQPSRARTLEEEAGRRSPFTRISTTHQPTTIITHLFSIYYVFACFFSIFLDFFVLSEIYLLTFST